MTAAKPISVSYHDDGYLVTFDPPLVVYREGLRSRDLGSIRRLEIKANGAIAWVQTDVHGTTPMEIEVSR